MESTKDSDLRFPSWCIMAFADYRCQDIWHAVGRLKSMNYSTASGYGNEKHRYQMRVSHDERTGIHRVLLEHGGVCVMHTDPAVGPERSFQRLAKHQVPLYTHARGARWNWTVRTTSVAIAALQALPEGFATHNVGEGLSLSLASWPLDADLLRDLHAELRTAMDTYGAADLTTVYGKTYVNNGRKILEQAMEDGQVYTYAGKTTAPGRAFGPVARQVLAWLAVHVFGSADVPLWAHLITYPNPTTCKLAWHSDSEEGINPHCICSITFLEDPEHGARPFDVRLKSVEAANKEARRVEKVSRHAKREARVGLERFGFTVKRARTGDDETGDV